MGAVVYMLVSKLMLKIGVDDPIDAIAVHAGGGDCLPYWSYVERLVLNWI